MSRYDSRTTIFSDEGRLFQVEYALETVNTASPTVGIKTAEGVVLAASCVTASPMLDNEAMREKIYAVDRRILCAVAGWTADANVLLQHARYLAQWHLSRFNTEILAEDLVLQLCNQMQQFTQRGGLRPFGVSLLFAAHAPETGFKLMLADPAGNYNAWKATAIGQNNVTARSILKQEWREDMTLTEGLKLAAEILKTIGSANTSEQRTEFAVVQLNEGRVTYRMLTREEATELIKSVQRREPERTVD